MRGWSSSRAILVMALALCALTSTSSSSLAANNVTPTIVNISLTTTVDPVYDVFGSGVSHVVAMVNGSVLTSSATPLELVCSFRPTQVNASAIVNDTRVKIPFIVSSGRYGTNFGLVLTLPANTTGIDVRISGSQGGSSFLWRYISEVPQIGLGTNLRIEVAYSSHVILPRGTVYSGLYGFNGTQLPSSDAALVSTAGSSQDYLFSRAVGTILLQSTLFVPSSIVVSAVSVIIFALASLNAFAPGRRYLQKISGELTLKLVDPTPGTLSSIVVWSKRILHRVRGLFLPKKLFALFLLCAVLMVSLGAIGGPDPRLHAYVVAAPGSVNQIQKNFASFEPNPFVLTPSQDYSDFEVMSSVADFNVAVISNYPSIALPSISGFVLRGLANVPVIVMDNQTDTGFANQINALYKSKVITVQNAANLTPAEKLQISDTLNSYARGKALGLTLSVDGFRFILLAEGVLSFALIFLGWGFIGSLASEAMIQSDLSQLARVLSSGVFVFLFSEIIYVNASILLAYPLSLHAVISGAKDVTAVGLLGFGGGSTPRLVVGVLGVIMGIGLTDGAPKLEKTDLAVILGIGLFILSDPLSLGQFAYQGLLLFIGNFSFGGAYLSSQSLKGFIYGIGSFLGGSVNSTYLLSAGKELYFAGLVPFSYLKRMGRSTTVIVALLSALLIGDGGVRVGEMTPEKSVIAVVPGLLAGFAFLIVLLGLAYAEKYVRGSRLR